MRKWYLIIIIFLSLTSQLYTQEKVPHQLDNPEYHQLIDFSSTNGGDFLLSTRTRQIWNSTSSIWVTDLVFEYSYNGQNLLDTLIISDWEIRRETFTYSGNRLILQCFSKWGLNAWWDSARKHYYYSGNNLRLVITSTYFGGTSWYDTDEWYYEWNNQDLISSLIYMYLHSSLPVWCNGYMFEYTYDSNNRLETRTEYEGVSCPAGWDLYKQELYTYDENGNNVEKLGQDWNPADSSWINDLLYRNEYDNSNLLVLTTYLDWNIPNSDWQNVWRESYTYTQLDSLETVLKETWSSEDEWENYTFRTVSYDNNGNWLEDVTQRWDSTHWVNYIRYLAMWDEPVSAKDDPVTANNYQLLQNYPNPFNPTTTINYKIPELSFVTIKIYDVLGSEIFTLANEVKEIGSYEVEFDAANLPSGIYFYKLQTGSFVETKKMVLMR